MARTILAEYKVESENLQIPVIITGGPSLTPLYELILVEISKATKALLDEIKHELILQVTINAGEILDPKVIQKLKDKFRQKAEQLIVEKLPRITDKIKNYLVIMLT